MTAIWQIWSEHPRAFASTGWRGQKALFGTDIELRPKISLQRKMISTTGKTLANLRGLPYMIQKFSKLWPRNGWELLASFAPPLNFRIGRHCQPYRMDVLYNRQQTNFGTRYVVAWGYSLEQQLVLLILHAHLPRDGGLLLFICHLFIKLVYAYR